MKKESYIFAVLLFAVLVVSRLVPHPNNFTALMAVALFSGSFWAKSPLRFVVPLAAMVATDIYFGIYPGLVFNYLGVIAGVFIAPALLGSAWSIAGRGLAASILFFVISNFGVWLQSGLYDLSFNGLVECYVLAIPFFQNVLLSTWLYSGLIYSTYRLFFAARGFEGFLTLNYGRQK